MGPQIALLNIVYLETTGTGAPKAQSPYLSSATQAPLIRTQFHGEQLQISSPPRHRVQYRGSYDRYRKLVCPL